ncbi:MAG: heparinase II/III domain-containing protein, partial [Betaproteobacteria bacterium]
MTAYNKLAFAVSAVSAVALLLGSILPSPVHAQSCVPGTAADWMATGDQLAARIRPADCGVVEQSPPDFGWPSTGANYQLTLTYPNGATKSVSTSKNWVNWSEVLPAGTYKWHVTANGTASRVRQFTVSANATPFLVPAASTVLNQLSAKARPRGLPSASMLATMKSQRSAAVDALLSEVRSKSKEALPGSGGGDAKIYSAAALQALAAAAYSQQGIYYNEAIRRVMNLAAWDAGGSSSYARDVEGARAVTWALAVGYDWLYSKLTSSQRSQLLAVLKLRTGDMYASVMGSIERYPRDAYQNQSLVFTAVISTLLAPDLADATAWLNATLPLALNSISPWAGDEGGFSNSQAQGLWDVGEQLLPWYVLRWATGIDLSKKAWVMNWARYMAYFSPIGSPTQAFGDGLELNLGENTARYGKGHTFFAPTPLGRWYASKLSGENQTGIEYLMAPPADFTTASFPAGTPNTAVLPTIGQLAMHSDLSDPQRTSVYFKSSPPPYGAYNHAHADQNSFVINAGGQRLAIESGYYDGYKTPHWTEWYKQTRAKNAITYDGGKGQAFYEQGGTMGYGTLTRHSSGPGYEIVTGDATSAYGGALTKAERSLIYLRPNLILVYDNLASQIGRQWEWNIHSVNAMNVTSGSKISIDNNGQTLCVDVLNGPARRFEQTDRFTADPSGTRPRQWHGKFYSTELLPAAEFIVLLNVGCTQATTSVTLNNGVWTVKVNEQTVQLGNAAISVNGSTAQEPAPAPAPAPVASTPYSGSPVAVPAVIEAENFDKGGQGVAYSDSTSGNAGAVYRTSEDVDLISSTDSIGGGYVVNNFATGEWLAYTISVPANAQYVVKLRTSNNYASTSAFHLQVDGAKVTGTIPVPMTDNWNTFQWVATPAIALSAGTHVLKVVADQQYFNLNSISVEAAPTAAPAPTASTPYTGTPIAVPVVFEAENFDKGGQGVAYNDTTTGNAGGVYRTAEDVDLIASTDSIGGGYTINNFATGEWLAYTIKVPASGQYVVQLRASNNYNSSSAFHLQVNGAKVTGSIPV